MLTLDEAIKHCEEKAKELKKDYERAVALNIPSEGCLECANEHEQLAGWLKDYKRLLEMPKAVEPFTQLEKEEIADAITYLLDAELLEENGYTEEVINALKSALKKVGGEGNETNN